MRIVLLSILVFSLFLMSCNNGGSFKTSPSGMQYQIFTVNEKNELPKEGDIIELEMVYKTESDSVLFNTREISSKFRMRLKKPLEGECMIDEGLAMLHVGDSGCFIVDAETFFLVNQGREVPKFIKPGDKLIFNVKLKEISSIESIQSEKDRTIAHNAQEEEMALKSFLNVSNITIEPKTSELYYVEERAGSGPSPKAGKKVVVNYTGTFINGQVFDSSYERNLPFEFVLGENQVIPGMEEGVSYMKVGSKAMLIIPSFLAYAENQYKVIPPFSTLIFYIELLEIK